MSQTKAQLIQPIGVVTASGVVVSGVMTAGTFDGDIVGSATSVIQGSNLNLGAFNATSFAGDFTGNATGIITSSAIKVGSLTASSFVGDFTGTATSMFKGTGFTAGTINAQGFVADVTGNVVGDVTGNVGGNVTGNVTGSASGYAGGLGVNYNGGWTGAGTSQINAGVMTATFYHGDGSNLDGVSSGPVSQQAVTIDGASTSIDLSNGNLIYATQSANTTVSFANSENGNVYFVRTKDNNTTARTITWPDRIKWEGGSVPTLISDSTAGDAQVFLLVTRDMGVTWQGKEVFEYDAPYRELWIWGRNNYGQHGDNSTTQRSSPVQVPGKWKEATFASNMVYSTKFDNTLWAWGENHRGQLGQNDNINRSSPTQIPGTTWSNVTVGSNSVLAIKTNGELWSWGYQYMGMLGQNTNENDAFTLSSPKQVGTDTTWSQTTGVTNKLAIKTDGTLWSWGYNNLGGSGLNDIINRSSPTQVGTNTTWSKISTGHRQTAMAIKTDGTLWGWGSGDNKIFAASDNNKKSSPVQIGANTNWKSVYQYTEGIQAFKTDGTLWMWGNNDNGTLGQNDRTAYSSPRQIPGTTWTGDAFTGPNFTLTTKTDGTLWAWGANSEAGVLGLDDRTNRSSPTQIPGTGWDYSKIFYQNYAQADTGIGIKE